MSEFISPAELMQRKINEAKRTVRFSARAVPPVTEATRVYLDHRRVPLHAAQPRRASSFDLLTEVIQ